MYNRFTGGYEYYISIASGNHVVKRIWENSDSEPEIMYSGSYKECKAYIENVIFQNYEYDNDI